jgi:hypothetical protein
MLTVSVGAEEAHEIGKAGVTRVRRWLDSTTRFAMAHSVYDLDNEGHPLTHVRLPLLSDTFQRFDLKGDIRSPDGQLGRSIYVECKNYTQAGAQSPMYDEYLAVCYSAFVFASGGVGAPASMEFMWATTHPFAVTHFGNLTTAGQVEAACTNSDYAEHLGGHEFDPSVGQQLADRLWLVIVNDRVEEMMMGSAIRAAVVAKMDELTH